MVTKLILSNELLKRLKKMDSEIAEKLLYNDTILDTDDPDYINYLGVSQDDPNLLSYLNKNKIDKIIEDDGDFWDVRKRIKGKAGKALRRILKSAYADYEYEKFVYQYRIYSTKYDSKSSDFQYEEVTGEKIRKYYLEDNYLEISGTLGNSCMRYSSCQDWFDIYVLNTSQVSMAVLLKDDKVAARCIVWHKNNCHYYDRIYAYDDKSEILLKSILESKEYVNIYDKDIDLSILLDYGFNDLDEFPYMDTMKYIDGQWLNTMGDGIELRGTDGRASGCQCHRCGSRVESDTDYIITIGTNEGETYCSNCCVYSSFHDGYIDNRCAIYSDYYRDYIFDGESVETEEGDIFHIDDSDDLYVEIDGLYHTFDEDNMININGTWYFKEDVEEELNQ